MVRKLLSSPAVVILLALRAVCDTFIKEYDILNIRWAVEGVEIALAEALPYYFVLLQPGFLAPRHVFRRL